MKARIIITGRVVNVEYVGFDNDGYSIYRNVDTGREYNEIELDFNVPSIGQQLGQCLREAFESIFGI